MIFFLQRAPLRFHHIGMWLAIFADGIPQSYFLVNNKTVSKNNRTCIFQTEYLYNFFAKIIRIITYNDLIEIVLLYIMTEILPQNFLYISKASEPHAAASGYRSPPYIFANYLIRSIQSTKRCLAFTALKLKKVQFQSCVQKL